MESGRQIEVGTGTERSDKVVRLPRDWLGPREHLVPLGESTPPPAEPDLATFAPDDFWGERAAAIHSAVQAPEAETQGDLSASDSPATVTSGPGRASARPRLGRQRLAALAVAGLAALATVAFLLGGSANHVTGGTRLNIAAILNSGVSRILKDGPPRVVVPTTSPRLVRHVRHRAPHLKPAPARAEHHTSPPPPSTYVARTYSPSPQPTYHPPVTTPAPRIVTSSHRAQSAASSGATVNPTGQNGALGPVQSPNG